eukprot:Skav200832  [mRNA]  locus=scaffold3034:121137:125135:+ [translate_table: standard]
MPGDSGLQPPERVANGDPGVGSILGFTCCFWPSPRERSRRVGLHQRAGTGEEPVFCLGRRHADPLGLNRYDIFTQPQADSVKLLESQWLELQQIVSWIDPRQMESQELDQVLRTCPAAQVLLAIRGLGKSKAVMQQISPELRRPERAVIHLAQRRLGEAWGHGEAGGPARGTSPGFHLWGDGTLGRLNHQNVVPSTRWLSEKGTNLFEEALLTHELFNLAQMLQGENCPANVKELHSHIEEKGELPMLVRGESAHVCGEHVIGAVSLEHCQMMSPGDALFRFYILFLLGFMSGLAGGQGSRFMNAKNADATIGGIRVLQKLMSVSATAPGSNKLGQGQWLLGPGACTLGLLGTCAGDHKGYDSLRFAWSALGDRERSSLTDHFLADGIEERAIRTA